MSLNDLETYTRLSEKIKAARGQIKEMNEARAAAEKRIKDYLKAHDQPGVNYQGHKIMLEERVSKARLKKADEKQRAIDILLSNGVANPEAVIAELYTFKKTSKEVLKIK